MDVALLGTGLMGAPMGQRLMEAGHRLHVYNRTPERALALARAGASSYGRPEQAVSAAECVVLMLSDAQAIRTILLGESMRGRLEGRSVIQMGTIAPEESRAFGEELQARGAEYLEAPVLGSTPEAGAGTLLVMVGATVEQFERWRPLLAVFGPEPMLIGSVGKAAALKLAMNQLIAGLTASFALSLGLIRREGVAVEAFMDLLRKSALYAPTFDKKLQRMLERDFSSPNFPLRHLLKDVRLFLEAARSQGLSTDALSGVERIIERAATDLADADYSGLYDAIDPPD